MATTAGAKKGLWSTIRRIAASDRISGLIMLGFALTGLVLANLPATAHAFETVAETHLFIPYTNLDLPIGHWAQDGLLTIFFLTVGLELKQELTTGSLANPKAAAVPMLCAVGGMIAPPILFLAVTALFSQIGPGEPGTLILTTTGSSIPFSEMSHGWAVPTATDIAFSLAVLALFAKALPGSIRAFLMTLATVDDLLAIILIAVFFSSINAWYWFIGIAVCAAIWAYLVRLKKVPWIAVGIVGILAWIMMFEAGVHPTLAGVLVGLLTPSREMHGELSPRAERYANKLQPFSALLALPIFAVVMFAVYWIAMGPFGTFLTDWTNDVLGTAWLVEIPRAALEGWGVNEVVVGLICDGALAGVGAVLGFVPQMLVLFLMLAILEDIGYMARIAFIMDRIFRKFGLSGKSFIPMLVGTGCGVPGVMASRTIENERDRRMTVMTTCFIPCGAKMPIIGLIAGALFGGSGLVAASAYFIGVAAIVISGIILKKTKMFAGDPAPFVMELPAYHIPSVGNVLRATWERGWSFIKRAGTVILASSIILWFLQGFGWENGAFGLVEDMNNSVLAAIGSAVAFIFAPLGFGNWRATVAVVTGLIAKENVVATFGVLYNFAGELSENGDEIWALVAQDYTAISAYSFMIFNLLCAPCFAAMGAIKREMNNAKWTAFAIGYMCVFAYVVSLIVYQIGGLITGEVSFGIGTVVAVVLVVGIVYLLFRKNKYEDERLTIRSVDAAGRRAALK